MFDNFDAGKLFALAGKFKGFLGFVAFVFLVFLCLFAYSFSQGSFDSVVKAIPTLDKDQIFQIIVVMMLMSFTVLLLLINLAYKSSQKAPSQEAAKTPGILHVTVHEHGKRTAFINDALVSLVPEQSGEGQQKKSNELGAVNFTLPADSKPLTFQINASKTGYQAADDQTLTIQAGHNQQIFIALSPINPS